MALEKLIYSLVLVTICCWVEVGATRKKFEEILIEKDFDEEQANGSVVLNLFDHIKVDDKTKNETVKSRFLSGCDYFFLNENDPWRIYSYRLDREKLCPSQKICWLHCKIYFEGNGDEIQLIELKINVRDVDDHRGKFVESSFTYEIDRSSSIGSRLQLEQIHDEDPEKFDEVFYLIESNFDEFEFPFDLNLRKDEHLLELTLKVDLKTYPLNSIVFSLLGKNQRTKETIDSCLIEVKFYSNELDELKFNQSKVKFFFDSIPTSNFLAKISVEPVDRPVFYRFIRRENNELFLDVNEQTGEIFFKQNLLTFLPDGVFEFFYEAFDLNFLSARCSIEIEFRFQRKNLENFYQIFVAKNFSRNEKDFRRREIFVEENLATPIVLAEIFFSNPLKSVEIRTNRRQFDENSFLLRRIDEKFSQLVLLKTFDFEQIRNLTVDLKFRFDEQIELRENLSIFVENLNDSPADFLQEKFFLSIEENFPVPSQIFRFQAEDRDENSTLNYFLRPELDEFVLNATSGELFVVQNLDREENSSFQFEICVNDGTFLRCRDVFLRILDQNDNRCSFKSSNVFLVVENRVEPSTFLFQFEATDQDFLSNGELFFFLNETSPFFHLDPKTGVLRTTSIFPANNFLERFHTEIVACDNVQSSIDSLCCSTTVEIQIYDFRRNRTIFFDFSNDEFLHYSLILNFLNQTSMPFIKVSPKSIVHFQHPSNIFLHPTTNQVVLQNLTEIQFPFQTQIHFSVGQRKSVSLQLIVYRNDQTHVSFHYLSLLSFSIFLFVFVILFAFLFWTKRRNQNKHKSFINTPSSVTSIASKTITQQNNQQTRSFQTYYSFDQSLMPNSTEL